MANDQMDPQLLEMLASLFQGMQKPPLGGLGQAASEKLKQSPTLEELFQVFQTIAPLLAGVHNTQYPNAEPWPRGISPEQLHWWRAWTPVEEPLKTMRSMMAGPKPKGHLPPGFNILKLFRH